MKIEKISENQIKFTLNRTDLASHQLKISELAYGTEKTKGLIQDMMDQASDELGFEANDVPLMIEAIPVSMDCIVLMVTKVDEPDEVDTKFSGFSNLKDLLAEEDEPEMPAVPAEEKAPPAEAPKEVPPCVQGMFANRRTPPKPGNAVTERMFSFAGLDDAINFAHQTGRVFRGEASLYRSPENGRYYLTLKNRSQDLRSFGWVCNCALEYGRKENFGIGREAFIREHYRCIICATAVKDLSEI